MIDFDLEPLSDLAKRMESDVTTEHVVESARLNADGSLSVVLKVRVLLGGRIHWSTGRRRLRLPLAHVSRNRADA
jgi:hypothetical protein